MAEKKERKGLTKPLVNNVGGVIDQDAPSADRLLEGEPDPTWGDTEVVEGRYGVPEDADSGLVPTVEERRWSPKGQ